MRIFIDSADIDEIRTAKEWGMLEGVTTNPSLIKKAVEGLKKKKQKIDIEGYIKELLKVAKGTPVSLEVVGTDFKEMVNEGKILYKKFNAVAKNVYVKIPVNPCLDKACKRDTDGIRAISALTKLGIPVNCTLIFTPEQALLAAKAGAKIVSPFVGREDDYVREINNLTFDKEDYFPAEGVKNLESSVLEHSRESKPHDSRSLKRMKKMQSDKGIVSGVDLIKECKEMFRAQGIKKCEILAASIRNVRQFREVTLAGADIVTLPLSVMGKLLEHAKTREGMAQFIKDIVPEYAQVVGYSGGKIGTRGAGRRVLRPQGPRSLTALKNRRFLTDTQVVFK